MSSKRRKTMIKISKLPLIKTPEQFFNTDKVLMVDMIELGTTTPDVLAEMEDKVLSYRGNMYLPFITTGTSQNFFLRFKKPFPFALSNGIKGLYKWDGDLNAAIREKRIFDFSDLYYNYAQGKVLIELENDFLIDQYIKNFQTTNN